MGFLVAYETIALSMSSLILKKLVELNIFFEDSRGQSYDNGANMKKKHKRVQARLLKKNPRSLYVSCGAHSLNLMGSDTATASINPTSYFDNVQNLHSLF